MKTGVPRRKIKKEGVVQEDGLLIDKGGLIEGSVYPGSKEKIFRKCSWSNKFLVLSSEGEKVLGKDGPRTAYSS